MSLDKALSSVSVILVLTAKHIIELQENIEISDYILMNNNFQSFQGCKVFYPVG